MKQSKAIRVMVVDDHPLLREGIAAVLAVHDDMQLVAEAADGAEALALFRAHRPDITLMDLQMPQVNGVGAIHLIRNEFAAARIMVLTTYRGDAQALRAMRAGAQGYLLKTALRRELVEAIRAVHSGQRFISQEVAHEIASHAMDESLSEREIEVLRKVASGHANKVIAAQLGVSEDTIKAHMKRILEKLDANDRTHAVAIGLRRGVIEG